MKKSQFVGGMAIVCGLLSACSHQHTTPATPVAAQSSVVKAPALAQMPPAVAVPAAVVQAKAKPAKPVTAVPVLLPLPKTHHNVTVVPTTLLPVPTPKVLPLPQIMPVAAALLSVPPDSKVRVKGNYRGSVPIAGSLRQNYQR